MELSKADQFWNRAALESGGESALIGDRALADLLLFHGSVMNGGLEHAFHATCEGELGAAVNGFRFFGLGEVAFFLEETARLSEEEQEGLNEKYNELVPSDQALDASFKEVFRSNPSAFAPLLNSIPQ